MVKVVYCGVCSIPPEYCEYGPQAVDCKEWLKKHHADLYAELYEAAALEKKMKKLAVSGEAGEGSEEGSDDDSGSGDDDEDGDKKKRQTRGGKGMPRPKKAAAPAGKKEVVISRKQRGGRKYVTTVTGLKAFDIDMKKAGKMFGQKFACGSSVSGDEITVQGDISDELMDYILECFPNIDEGDISLKDDKPPKKKAEGK